jgi:hypothetical protein
MWGATSSFRSLDFAPADPLYYQYAIMGSTDACGGRPSNNMVYTFSAAGDLDGDMTNSNFEIAVGANEDNELYRSPGLFIENELE